MKYLYLVTTMMHPSKVKSINNCINVITHLTGAEDFMPEQTSPIPPPENFLNKSFD